MIKETEGKKDIYLFLDTGARFVKFFQLANEQEYQIFLNNRGRKKSAINAVLPMYVYVCLCVCERERERGGGRVGKERERDSQTDRD